MAYDGSVRINTEIDTKGFVAGRKALESGMAGIKNSLSKLALTLGTAFGFQEAIKSAESLQNAMMGLQSIVEGQGRSFEQAQAFIQSYISDGLVPLTNAATAYKNLAARGYGDEQIQQVMVALKDSAAFGRQANLSLGEAVQSATEGLKNENSILVDNAGVTKNVAKMWDEYAESVGTTANNLTQEQKIQAEVNGILAETRFQTGDAAKASESYSGQIAKTAFQFNELKVALGNLGMTLVQSALPGINALLSSLTAAANTAAQFVAVLFGVEQEKTASSAAKAAKEEQKLATQISKTAKAAKSAVSSIDELNIVQQDTKAETGSSSGSSSSTEDLPVLSGEIGKDVKLSPNLQKIAEQIRDFFVDLRDALHDFSPLLKGVGTAFAVAFSMNWAAGAIKKFKSLSVITSVSKAIRNGLLAMNTNFEATGKLLPSISKGMKEFRGNLSTTAKVMVGAGGFAAAFVTTKNAVSDFVEGEIEADEAIANVAITAGVTGAALYTFLGPWGLLIEAIGLAAGALIGYIDAQNRLREERIDAEFFDGAGASLDIFNSYLLDGQEAVSGFRQRIEELSQELTENQTTIDQSNQTLGVYQNVLSGTGTLTKEQTEKMESAYKSLIESMRENLEINSEIIYSAFNTSSEEAAKNLGLNVAEMTTILEGFKQTFATKTNELNKKLEPFWEKLRNNKILTEEDQAEFGELLSYVNKLSTGVSENQVKLKNQLNELSKINFEDTETAAQKIGEIQETAASLVKEIENAKTQTEAAFATLQHQAGVMFDQGDLTEAAYKQATDMFSRYSSGISDGYDQQKESVETQISAVLGAIQSQFDTQVDATARLAGGTLWDSIDAILAGESYQSEGYYDYIYNKSKKAVQERLKPVQEAINNASSSLKVTPSRDLGEDLIDGMKNGIQDNAYKVEDAATKAAKDAQEAVKKADDSHSPSRKYYEFGRNDMEGYRNGIQDH